MPRNVLLLVYVTEINFELVTVYDHTKEKMMTELKYELVENSFPGGSSNLLYRIRALRDFADVKAGDFGGFVNGPDNLSQYDNCWVYDEAILYENSRVTGNAQVRNDAVMTEHSFLTDFAKLINRARIGGNVKVYGHVVIKDNALLTDNVTLNNDVVVGGYAFISGRAHIHDSAVIDGASIVKDGVQIFGDAQIGGSANIRGHSIIGGKAIINQRMRIDFGFVDIDLTASLIDSIRCQTGLTKNPITNTIICYKRVAKGTLSSFYDYTFVYKVGEYVEAPNPVISNDSCASGLHFSYTTYWDAHVPLQDTVLLMCEVHIDDVITCQEGKIRAKKCFVIGICG